MQKWTAAIAMMFVLSLAPAGQAAGEKDGEIPAALPEVVVTATRYNEETRNIPANVTVIGEAQIKNSGAQNIPELLRSQPGVIVNDINGSRRSYTVDLRGFGETAGLNTLVLVDGRRINQADLSGTDWVQIPLDRVERIEIIRGGRESVLYGDNAAGGVINIITREGDRFKAGFTAAGGSYDTYQGSAYASGGLDDLFYSLSGSYLDTDGYRDNGGQEAKDAGLNLNYYPQDRLKFNFSTGYHKDDAGLPGALTESELAAGADRTDTVHPDDFADTEDYYFKGGSDFLFAEDSVFKLDTAYRKRNVSGFASFAGGNFTADTGIETISASPRLVLKNQLRGIRNSFSAGFDYEHVTEDIKNDLFLPPFSSLDRFKLQRKSYGAYLYDDFKPLSDLSLSFGYRRDRADFDFSSSAAAAESVSLDEDAYTAGVNYTVFDQSYVYLSYARSFRYPVLDEFFDFTSNSVKYDLKPQDSNDYELGFRYYFNDASYANLNIFRIDTTDELFYNPVTYENTNLDGETRRRGVEVAFVFVPEKWLSLNGSYTYTDAKIRSGQFEGKDIPGVPNHQATVGALLTWRKASLALNGRYVGERPFISDFENVFGPQKDYLVFNARLSYVWSIFTAFLDVNNITNEKYSEYGVIGSFPPERAYYPSPERNFLAGVSLDF